MKDTPFIRTTVAILIGPIVWAVHFLVIYVVTALACARHFASAQWLGMGAVQAMIVAATVVSLVVLAIAMRLLRPAFSGLSGDSQEFARNMAVALALLSVLAIVWDALPAFMVPVCR